MKNLTLLARINNWVIYIILTAVVAGISISSWVLIDYLRKEESKRMAVFATAMRYMNDEYMGDPRVLDMILTIMKNETAIPVIVTDRFDNPTSFVKNVSLEIANNPDKLRARIKEMEKSYKPIENVMPDGNNQYIYYDNSDLLNNLRYYPLVLGLFVMGYIVFSFWFLRTLKKTDEGFLWAGLAKETAHQIGTPLSSMIGWVEIMKLENENGMGVKELEKDVERLKTISERFSKIGSIPALNDLDINETVQQNYEYLRTRISSKVQFKFQRTYEPILLPHSKILISWVIENLVKNAVDAMKGEGKLEILLYNKGRNVFIDVIDTGAGMTKSQIRKVFKPGYSTKKRGWGLGLSLANRVINEYHKGEIKIANSEVGKGTTFRIILKMPKE